MEEAKVDKAIEQAMASMGFEGMQLTEEEVQILKQELMDQGSLLLALQRTYEKRQSQKEKNGNKIR